MTLRRKDQKGFALLESFLILVIISLIAGTGWYVWHSKQNTEKNLSNAKLASESSPVAKKKSSSAADKTAQSYLVIKEWGVKMPLETTTEDSYYRYDNRDSGYAYLSLNSLVGTECAADKVTLGVLSRFTASDKNPQSSETWLSENPSATKVGSYYFIYTSPQAGCILSSQQQLKADNAKSAFKEEVKKIIDS